jgi:threonyl-tRNA synthetase
VIGIPVAQEYHDYLFEIADRLKASGIRVEVDTSDDRFPKKIRTAQKSKVPFMLIAGEDDRSAGAVSFRYRDGSQKNGVPIAEAITEIVEAVESRRQV